MEKNLEKIVAKMLEDVKGKILDQLRNQIDGKEQRIFFLKINENRRYVLMLIVVQG